MDQSIRITLVRHGESTSNRSHRWQGQGDSPLSDLGRLQAAAAGLRLRARRFDRVVSSDLSRAVDTARATGFDFEQLQEFREFDVGRWEGLTREEVEAQYPEELERLKEGEDIPLGGGESFGAFAERIDAALERLCAGLSPGQSALVVCHGGVIGTALSGLLGLRGRRKFPLARVSNTGISEVILQPQPEGAPRPTLRVFNDARHVAGLNPWPPLETDSGGCLALVCGGRPDAAFGAFEAYYEAEEALETLASLEAHDGPERRLIELASALHARHPAQRISLSASAELVHAWAASTIWSEREAHAQLGQPGAGSLSHVAQSAAGLVLLDYGVSLD